MPPEGSEINCRELMKPGQGMECVEAGENDRRAGSIAHNRISPFQEPKCQYNSQYNVMMCAPDAKRSVPRKDARLVIHLAPFIS
jgi:hypothetical protein